MNRAGRVLFILGLFISFISGVGVFVLLLLAQPKPTEIATTRVVVAYQEIPGRSEIGPDQVGTTQWPRPVPTPIGALDDPTKAVGKLATGPIYPGQPIVTKMLVDKSAAAGDSRGTAAYVLEKGSVAMAMPITVKSSVADAIQVGDRVDLIVTMHSPSSTSISTQRLLADVLILQVGSWQKAQNQSGTASSIVTFQLKEQDALALEYTILHADALTMVLRPANDHELAPLEPVTFDYINQRFGFRLPR